MDKYDFTIIRDLRKSQGLTIADLAKSSGISTAVVSRIERNQACPELNTLFRLARVFDLRVADLIGLAESGSTDTATANHYNSGGFQFQHVHFRNTQCFLGTAMAGGSTVREEIHHNDLEICWVLNGSVELNISNDTHVLKEGQAIQFDAALKHKYLALEDCKILLIHMAKGHRGT
jgi:DNA-binding XRE family transcriptional regulator